MLPVLSFEAAVYNAQVQVQMYYSHCRWDGAAHHGNFVINFHSSLIIALQAKWLNRWHVKDLIFFSILKLAPAMCTSLSSTIHGVCACMWDLRRASGGEWSPCPALFNRMETVCLWLRLLPLTHTHLAHQWPVYSIQPFGVISMQQSFSFRGTKGVDLPKGTYNFLQSEVSHAPLLIDRLGDPPLYSRCLSFLSYSLSIFPSLLCQWLSLSFSLAFSPHIVQDLFLEQVWDH